MRGLSRGFFLFTVAARCGDDLIQFGDADPDRLCRTLATLGVFKPGQPRQFSDQSLVAQDAGLARARLPQRCRRSQLGELHPGAVAFEPIRDIPLGWQAGQLNDPHALRDWIEIARNVLRMLAALLIVVG